MSIETAILADGQRVRFRSEMIGEGGMKEVYFTEDKSSVVCFFKGPSDPHRQSRLESVLGKFNPTLDGTSGHYWKGAYCWPTGIITSPRLGVLCPSYPSDYFFKTGPFQGKEKEGRWFTSKKLRAMLPEVERGSWINYFALCIKLSRAVRRLHQAGLAHSDLSNKNVLVDPSIGQSIVIDIDSLVVPTLYPPDVLGTPGYIAPEVLETVHLPLNDPNRKHPCAQTDQHALSVLVYEYLLFRHPLRGKKVHSVVSAEEDEHLSMGAKALFIEHPTDKSNPPMQVEDTKVQYMALGPHLRPLFEEAFVKGLHAPHQRPPAIAWERALVKTWDLLHPCGNPSCPQKYFVLSDHNNVKCLFCGSKPKQKTIPVLLLRKEGKPGNWLQDAELVMHYDGTSGTRLHKWHVFDNVFPGENITDADKQPLGYCVYYQDQWLLVNQNLPTLTSPSGNRVPVGQAVALTDGALIRLSQEPHGRMAQVKIVKP